MDDNHDMEDSDHNQEKEDDDDFETNQRCATEVGSGIRTRYTDGGS